LTEIYTLYECNKGRACIPTDNVLPLDIRRVKRFCSLNSFAQCPNSHREYLPILVQRVLLKPNFPHVKCTARVLVGLLCLNTNQIFCC